MLKLDTFLKIFVSCETRSFMETIMMKIFSQEYEYFQKQ